MALAENDYVTEETKQLTICEGDLCSSSQQILGQMLSLLIIPSCFKSLTNALMPKMIKVACQDDWRPVALTGYPPQFAYCQNKATVDDKTMDIHSAFTHLEVDIMFLGSQVWDSNNTSIHIQWMSKRPLETLLEEILGVSRKKRGCNSFIHKRKHHSEQPLHINNNNNNSGDWSKD